MDKELNSISFSWQVEHVLLSRLLVSGMSMFSGVSEVEWRKFSTSSPPFIFNGVNGIYSNGNFHVRLQYQNIRYVEAITEALTWSLSCRILKTDNATDLSDLQQYISTQAYLRMLNSIWITIMRYEYYTIQQELVKILLPVLKVLKDKTTLRLIWAKIQKQATKTFPKGK